MSKLTVTFPIEPDSRKDEAFIKLIEELARQYGGKVTVTLRSGWSVPK